MAKIDAEGATVTVQPETVLQFRGNEIVLDHGSLQVDTSRGLKVRVNCLTVVPVNSEWTQFDVTDVNGKGTVDAHKNDVNIHAQSALVKSKPQAPRATRRCTKVRRRLVTSTCPAAERLPGSIDANGAWLNSWWAKGIEMAAVGVIVCKAFCFHGDDPVSPSKL